MFLTVTFVFNFLLLSKKLGAIALDVNRAITPEYQLHYLGDKWRHIKHTPTLWGEIFYIVHYQIKQKSLK